MHRGAKLIAVLGSVSAVAACTAAPPSGPTVMALPPNGKSLDAFQQEDGQCRNYAAAAIGPYHPARAGARAAVGSAATGTVLGAAAGSAIGAAAGNAGAGAAIGGAAGLVGGTAVGANNVAAGEYDLQTRYNIAYTQCMYSRGDTVQYLPASSYGYNGYADWGYPWYGWGGPWLAGGDVFAFDDDRDFHHGFRDHFHNGFHGGFHGGGGGHH
jgi:Glycine-zipper domain